MTRMIEMSGFTKITGMTVVAGNDWHDKDD